MAEEFPKLSSVSFFCPAYHDQDNLPELIPDVYKFISSITDTFEILIVEDGSPDKTAEVADQLAAQYPHVRVIHHSKNCGYGGALKTGFSEGRYDYVMYTDGDKQYDITEFKPHLHLLSKVDVLCGYVTEKAASSRRKWQSLIYNSLIRILFFIDIKDINCSMKICNRKVLDAVTLKSASAFIDAEIVLKSKKAGFVIGQIPVTHYRRAAGLASGSKAAVIWPTIVDMLKFRVGLL